VYMVMNYESGMSLQQHVIHKREQVKGLGSAEVVEERLIRRMFKQIMNGLREVHTNKLLHLDLKPANIYLRHDGTPILLDFGAARQTLNTDGPRLFPMYTPGFAAPELYQKTTGLGPWTDIYGLGACMFSCMAGSPPQAADERLKQDKMRSAFKALRGAYSDDLVELVEWCLMLDPLERPQSVFQLQRNLSEKLPSFKKRTLGERLKMFLLGLLGRKKRRNMRDTNAVTTEQR
jgi:eukaryotic-like serine/threonine-protein kinase